MKNILIKIAGTIVGLGVCYLILSYLSSNFNPWEWNIAVKIFSIAMIMGSLRNVIED